MAIERFTVDGQWLVTKEPDGSWEICDGHFGNEVIGHMESLDELPDAIEAGRLNARLRSVDAGCYAPSGSDLL